MARSDHVTDEIYGPIGRAVLDELVDGGLAVRSEGQLCESPDCLYGAVSKQGILEKSAAPCWF
jgi:hypothetical protein